MRLVSGYRLFIHVFRVLHLPERALRHMRVLCVVNYLCQVHRFKTVGQLLNCPLRWPFWIILQPSLQILGCFIGEKFSLKKKEKRKEKQKVCFPLAVWPKASLLFVPFKLIPCVSRSNNTIHLSFIWSDIWIYFNSISCVFFTSLF